MEDEIIKELLALEAWATGTAQQAARIREKLQSVSTGGSKKKKLEDAARATLVTSMLAKKHKRLTQNYALG